MFRNPVRSLQKSTDEKAEKNQENGDQIQRKGWGKKMGGETRVVFWGEVGKKQKRKMEKGIGGGISKTEQSIRQHKKEG